ncbi:MAG: hypothetical protein HUJ57_08635 [Erysipelotrichaceae bacterium]|nr:hypothetical protein [Erysipelotrichaceae bacterium]
MDCTDRRIQLAILLKYRAFLREGGPFISYQNIEDVLNNWVWKKEKPCSLHVAVNDVLSLTSDFIVQCLSSQAIIDSYLADLSSYEDIIGGESE